MDILRRSLEAPIRVIAANSGAEGAVVLDAVGKGKGNFGFDALEDKYGDMLEFGIIDPAKVVKSALTNAASIAGLMLTTQVLVTRTDDLEGGDKSRVEGAIR